MICYSRYAFTNTPFGHRLALSNIRWSCGDSLTQNDRYPSYFVLIASHLTVSPVSRLTYAATSPARVLVASPVPARYVRQSQLCPQLDVSDKNVKKTQDMSDRARYVLQKM